MRLIAAATLLYVGIAMADKIKLSAVKIDAVAHIKTKEQGGPKKLELLNLKDEPGLYVINKELMGGGTSPPKKLLLDKSHVKKIPTALKTLLKIKKGDSGRRLRGGNESKKSFKNPEDVDQFHVNGLDGH